MTFLWFSRHRVRAQNIGKTLHLKNSMRGGRVLTWTRGSSSGLLEGDREGFSGEREREGDGERVGDRAAGRARFGRCAPPILGCGAASSLEGEGSLGRLAGALKGETWVRTQKIECNLVTSRKPLTNEPHYHIYFGF